MFALSVESFRKIAIHIVKAKENEIKERYLQGAFIGWQMQEIIKGALSENPKPQRFFDYAAQMGLVDKPKTKKETAADAIALAEAIKAADQKGTNANGNNSV